MYVREEYDSSLAKSLAKSLSREMSFSKNLLPCKVSREKSLAKIPPRKGFSLLLYVRWVGGWWGDGAVVLDDVFVTHVKLGRGVPVRQK